MNGYLVVSAAIKNKTKNYAVRLIQLKTIACLIQGLVQNRNHS